jgi:putative ABC transport system ATP-binding protein
VSFEAAGLNFKMQQAPETVFRARGLTRVFRMGEVEIQALRGVDMDLYAGEFVVLLGASGSGKSTLLNILGGLDAATGGEVFYRDHNLSHADERELTLFRRRHVGFVFQFYNLIPSLTARENVAIVTEIAEQPMDREQQRVAIARAIAKNPMVLLCDEPTGSLDSVTGVRVLQVLDDINRRLGTTTAVVTHNAVIADMADRMIRLSDGRVSEVKVNPVKTDPADLHW